MAATLQDTVRMFEEFKVLFNQPQPPLPKCQELFNKLKVAMTSFQYPTTTNTEEQTKQLLVCSNTYNTFKGEILEHGVLLSIQTKDIPSFERCVAQLKVYYFDYATKLPESGQQYPILGLNLLRLLAQSKLDSFHTELELIPIEKHSNLYIKHPILLEQYMMEGSYNKVLKGRDVPSQTYTFFMDILMETVRNEIGDCVEKAYDHLNLPDAQKLLVLASPEQLKQFISQRQWKVSNGQILFGVEDGTKKEIPTMDQIQTTLYFARELERIV